MFGTHIKRRSDHRKESRVNRFVRQLLIERFGHTKVNHFRDRSVVVQRHHNVGWFDVSVNDTFLMSVMDGGTHIDHQIQTFANVHLFLVAELGDGQSPHQFHDEVGPVIGGHSRIENLGDIGMIHQRDRLSFGLEPSDHLF